VKASLRSAFALGRRDLSACAYAPGGHDPARVSDPSGRSAGGRQSGASMLRHAPCPRVFFVGRRTVYVPCLPIYLPNPHLQARVDELLRCLGGLSRRRRPDRTLANLRARVSVRGCVCIRECVRTCLARVPVCAGAGASAQARAWASEAQMRSSGTHAIHERDVVREVSCVRRLRKQTHSQVPQRARTMTGTSAHAQARTSTRAHARMPARRASQ
jgi:hypothetical protein